MQNETKKLNLGLIMAVYLLGIFMGAIDTGIVTPARTIIQNGFGLDGNTGIWMITIYTLAYAASIPIMGKLADKYGRKYIYLFSIFLFGTGSLFCGLSENFGSFEILLIARAVQAVGGGGIVPVATAEFGTIFQKEKRGMALGLVGGVYGMANIFGSSAGSAILDMFGKDNWQFIFYVNVPITILILAAGLITLPNTKEVNIKRIDFFGIVTLTGMILSLLYGLKNIDFFAFRETIVTKSVYPFLILFLVLLPVFILAEKKAEDPVINLDYFKNARIVITLLISIITGIVMMGMIFVPQFAENALKIASGSGGYFVIILGVFAGVGAPISGKLIDKYGVKVVLGFGFLSAMAGSLFLVFVTTKYPSFFTVAICLVLTGLGIGFTMGTPLNYMMLDNTEQSEAGSALATVSLVRSIGTAVAPAIMVGFLSHAGAMVQGNLMPLLPNDLAMPQIPYTQELNEKIDALKSNEMIADQLTGLDKLEFSATPEMNMTENSGSGDIELPPELLASLQSADVTTITEKTKEMADYVLSTRLTPVADQITSGIDKGIQGVNTGITTLDSFISEMQAAEEAMKKAAEMAQAGGNTDASAMMPQAGGNAPEMPQVGENTDMAAMAQAGEDTGAMPQASGDADAAAIGMIGNGDITEAITGMTAAKEQMTELVMLMSAVKDAVPETFATYKENYLTEIDNRSDVIEKEFQNTLNKGFQQIYLTTTAASLLALLLLTFYKKKKN